MKSTLQQEQINPVHLAVDRPSEKFTGFLAKHYKLRAKIPQVNNYVVFEGFFSRRTGEFDKIFDLNIEGFGRDIHCRSVILDDVVKRSRRTQPPAAGGNDRRISAKRYIDTDSFETSITNSCSTSSRVRSGEVGSNQLTRHTNNPVATTVPNGSQHSLQSVASTGSSNSDEVLSDCMLVCCATYVGMCEVCQVLNQGFASKQEPLSRMRWVCSFVISSGVDKFHKDFTQQIKHHHLVDTMFS